MATPTLPITGSVVLQLGSGAEAVKLPVCVDHEKQLQKFLDERLPIQDLLFSRHRNQPEVNPLECGNQNDYLKPPYPELPPVKVGELQWPTGASRYGRALYAVDWPTMRAIAISLWGFEPPTELIDPEGNPDDPENQQEIALVDVPETWGTSRWSQLTLVLNGFGEGLFYAEMYALAPYRVTGFGYDLWLLPLVDKRYRYLNAQYEGSESPTWKELIQDLAGALSAGIEFPMKPGETPEDPEAPEPDPVVDIPEAYGEPSARLWDLNSPQPAASMLDVAALSIGMRIVFEPITGKLRLINQELSEHRRQERFGFVFNESSEEWTGNGSLKLIAGGRRGKGPMPEYINVYMKGGEGTVSRQGAIPGGAILFPDITAWSSFEIEDGDDALALEFVDQLATDIGAWGDCGGQYTFIGPPSVLNTNGYDDWVSIEIVEIEHGQQVYRTRVIELPRIFLPRVILAGGLENGCGGGGDFLYNYTLTSDWSNTVADADITTSRNNTSVETGVPVYDPLELMTDQTTGDVGFCISTSEGYIAIQAPCTSTSEGSSGGGDLEPPIDEEPIAPDSSI